MLTRRDLLKTTAALVAAPLLPAREALMWRSFGDPTAFLVTWHGPYVGWSYPDWRESIERARRAHQEAVDRLGGYGQFYWAREAP